MQGIAPALSEKKYICKQGGVMKKVFYLLVSTMLLLVSSCAVFIDTPEVKCYDDDYDTITIITRTR